MENVKDSMKTKVDNAFKVFEKSEPNVKYIVDAAEGFVIGTFTDAKTGDVIQHFTQFYKKFTIGLTGDIFVYEEIKKKK